MFTGGINLSRARGTKAQQRRSQIQYQTDMIPENTIDFHKAARRQQRNIELVPRSRAQENLIVSLQDPQTFITVALGPAGTGKSYLAMMAALRDLRLGRVERVVLTRPAVGVEDENHGFLPGDLIRKMEPWTRPLLDIMKEFYHVREITRMIEDEIIEISPLAFMRGRTFKNSWIIADEMQNATPNQMKMLLTRLGANSKIAVTGDVEQTDRASANNGLLDLGRRLGQGQREGIDICYLGTNDIQRHPIIAKVLHLYQD